MTVASLSVDTARPFARMGDDPDAVRAHMGNFPSAVVALCADVDGVPVGMSASSFTVGVSYDPPLALFAVQQSSATWRLLSRAGRVGVSVFGEGQAADCLRLASRSADRFADLRVSRNQDGAVFVDGAPIWYDCELVSETPAGDHQIVVLKVHGVSVEEGRSPLVYRRRNFHTLLATA